MGFFSDLLRGVMRISHNEVDLVTERGHVNRLAFELNRKLLHRRFFAVNQEGAFAVTDLAVPGQEFALIGMGGEAVDGVDGSADRDILSEQIEMAGAIDDVAGRGAGSGKSDEDDGGFLAPEIVTQMVTDAAASTHARTGHDHGTAADAVDGDGIGRFPGEMELRQFQRVAAISEQGGYFWAEAFGVTGENLGGGDRHGGVEEHLDARRQFAAINALTQDKEKFLRPIKGEGRDNDVAAARQSGGNRLKEFCDRLVEGAVVAVAVGGLHHDKVGLGRRHRG